MTFLKGCWVRTVCVRVCVCVRTCVCVCFLPSYADFPRVRKNFQFLNKLSSFCYFITMFEGQFKVFLSVIITLPFVFIYLLLGDSNLPDA